MSTPTQEPIQLVLCDMDGTLLKRDHSISPRTLAAVKARQAAGTALAFAEDAHKRRKGMFGGSFGDQRGKVGHKQFVGLGRPASLAASLAGVPLNSRLRCRLLPFSGPSFKAVYLISGRVAGDSSNS